MFIPPTPESCSGPPASQKLLFTNTVVHFFFVLRRQRNWDTHTQTHKHTHTRTHLLHAAWTTVLCLRGNQQQQRQQKQNNLQLTRQDWRLSCWAVEFTTNTVCEHVYPCLCVCVCVCVCEDSGCGLVDVMRERERQSERWQASVGMKNPARTGGQEGRRAPISWLQCSATAGHTHVFKLILTQLQHSPITLCSGAY